MEPQEILKSVSRIRHAYVAMGERLEKLEKELEKFQSPPPKRKRRDLKTARVEKYERMYALGKWSRKVK